MFKLLCAFIFMMTFADKKPESKNVDISVHLRKVINHEVTKECSSCQVELIIHNPKVVDDIQVPDQVISERWKGQTNLILKVGDENRIVTVTIRWKDKVVIAKENIRQGEIINKSDLRVVEKDVTFNKITYAQKVEQVTGMVGQRVFQRGQIIDESLLKKPLVVRYGQPIQVIIQQDSLQLSMSGQAKGAGAIGDRIPVYITKTRKNLSAVIIDKTTLRVE